MGYFRKKWKKYVSSPDDTRVADAAALRKKQVGFGQQMTDLYASQGKALTGAASEAGIDASKMSREARRESVTASNEALAQAGSRWGTNTSAFKQAQAGFGARATRALDDIDAQFAGVRSNIAVEKADAESIAAGLKVQGVGQILGAREAEYTNLLALGRDKGKNEYARFKSMTTLGLR